MPEVVKAQVRQSHLLDQPLEPRRQHVDVQHLIGAPGEDEAGAL
jgi:hypothetical protein